MRRLSVFLLLAITLWMGVAAAQTVDETQEILADWETELANFVQVCPTEMLIHLPAPLSEAPEAVPAE